MNNKQKEQLPFLQQVLYYLENPSQDNGHSDYYYERAKDIFDTSTDILSDDDYKETLKPLTVDKITPKVKIRTIAEYIKESKMPTLFKPQNIIDSNAENKVINTTIRDKNGNIPISELIKQSYYIGGCPQTSSKEDDNDYDNDKTYSDYRFNSNNDTEIQALRKELYNELDEK